MLSQNILKEILTNTGRHLLHAVHNVQFSKGFLKHYHDKKQKVPILEDNDI